MLGKAGTRFSQNLVVDFDEKKVDTICAEIDQCYLPGIAIGIAFGGKPVYRKGFGLASMELPVGLSPTMRMRIGSTSKHFASLAYLLLCEVGKAGIDDPIGQHLPELNPAVHAVTVRQLMGHTGGIRDVTDLLYQFSGTGRAVSSEEQLALYRDIVSVNCPPGIAWNYNNGGYLILSAVIERIVGKPLEDIFRELIFEPIGLHDTLLRRLDTDFVPNSATLHMTRAGGGFEKSYLGIALSGDGGIVSTVDDMLRWLAHMDAPIVGSETTWQAMKTPLTLPNDTSTGYGLGLMTGRYRGVDTLHHGGWVMGGNSEMLKVPAMGLDIVVIVNRSDVFAKLYALKILDACLPSLEPLQEPSRKAARLTGVFRSPATGRIIQLHPNEDGQLVSIDGMDLPCEPDDTGTLRPGGIWHYLKLVITPRGDAETPQSLRFESFGNVDELMRVSEIGMSEPEPDAILGHYRSVETATVAALFKDGQGVTLHTTGPFGSAVHSLERLAQGVWRARSSKASFLTGILSFEADCRGFDYSNSRTWALSFKREA
jgi:CubicO group peptidase (beta-lactamase class C family)